MERYINKIGKRPPYHVSDDIRRVHDQLVIVDLHADSLLWNRDLLERSNYGHVDFQRLSDGNVAIQVFGVVTGFPFGINLKKISLNIDLVTLLSMINHWPLRTWWDPFQRAVYQSQKLEELIGRSNGKMILIKNIKDMDRFLTLRKNQRATIGSMLALEGAHALNGELSNLKILYDLSFRIFGISHFSDNEAGGSAHGREKGGLSAFGHELVEMLQEMHMIIDLSHASGRVIDEVTQIVETPVIVSHTGVCGICNNPRNLTDSQIRKIARAGGLIGIAMFRKATCGKRIENVARTIRYVADLAGVDCVAIGSDFDGAITAPFDASGLSLLTEGLLAQSFNESQITKIMGGNALRVFREALPTG
jgi:microsomal dipeptidase-like Zn-dependent dipeptidase